MANEPQQQDPKTDVAQQDALSNAFMGIFGIAVLLMAQMGLGGIERRAFDTAYGRDVTFAEKQRLLELPRPPCVVGSKHPVLSEAFLLANGPVLLESPNRTFREAGWQEDVPSADVSSALPRRFLYRLPIFSNPETPETQLDLKNLASGDTGVWIFADDRLLALTEQALKPNSSWRISNVNGGLVVSKEPCP